MEKQNKKVLIFGLGTNQGGVGSARFFAKNGYDVTVTDLRTESELKDSISQLADYQNIKYVLGEHRFEDFDQADLIIKNPAIKSDNKYLLHAKEQNKTIEMDIGVFLEFIKPSQIIGVTGSKGKSSTASMIYEVLKDSGKEVILVGNIGKSVLDALEFIKEETVVVVEISSFQLEAFEQYQVSPHIAVITNIFPEHLNYYAGFDDYVDAKRIIAKYQTSEDWLFIKKGNQVTDSKEFLKGIKSQVVRFSTRDLGEEFKPELIGEHNRENFAAALAVLTNLGIEDSQIKKVLAKFRGVEFRLQLIKEFEGIKIYNDSTATHPDAAIRALEALPGSILIAGGMNKKLDYTNFAKAIERLAKSVYFLEGDATEELRVKVQESRVKGIYDNLDKLLEDVKKEVKSGDVVLFAPGATSFNLFQNEFDRGRKFNEVVEKIFK